MKALFARILSIGKEKGKEKRNEREKGVRLHNGKGRR
jgi:hypothetical protein